MRGVLQAIWEIILALTGSIAMGAVSVVLFVAIVVGGGMGVLYLLRRVLGVRWKGRWPDRSDRED